ncbi:hypothetical protein SAMN04488055_2707 [Chitinophaga niabensis]|uniref:Uncharacterized protein n=1 Tax=Chitinophaga niabensis TaxID=536979 RepID=A0A1N6GCZ2_9BACT|nr:hypothetical protein SAMN04488055_2707 [Chitinophaga niabensis]
MSKNNSILTLFSQYQPEFTRIVNGANMILTFLNVILYCYLGFTYAFNLKSKP